MSTRDERDRHAPLLYRFPDEFPHIYDDDRAFAAFCRLLLLADASWPLHPPIPASVNRKALELLVGSELVILERDRYTIRGMDKRRSAQSEAARNAAAKRWDNARNAGASGSGNATSDATQLNAIQPNVTQPRAGLPHVTERVDAAWHGITGHWPEASGSFAGDYLDDACRRHSEAKVLDAMKQARRGFDHIPSTQQLASAMRAILDPLPNSKQVSIASAEERERLRSQRAVENTLQRNHDMGAHADDPSPGCPKCKQGAA